MRAALLLLLMLLPAAAQAQTSLDADQLREVGIEQRIEQQIPLDASFVDEQGRDVQLREFFADEKPVVLALVYNRCPMLCNMVLSGLISTLRVMKLEPGKDFEVLAVSFDSKEPFTVAARQKAKYLKRYGRVYTEPGWHFLTGGQPAISALTEAVGFNYRYDPNTDQFAHASAILVLTPQGEVARYFYGTEYSPRDVRLALVEASAGKVGSVTDDLLLLCYRYDPSSGTYSASAINAIRVGGTFTLLGLVVFVAMSLRRERRGQLEPQTEERA